MCPQFLLPLHKMFFILMYVRKTITHQFLLLGFYSCFCEAKAREHGKFLWSQSQWYISCYSFEVQSYLIKQIS